MAFVANARPEQSDTHSCSLNKGIGWKSRTRKESAVCLQSPRIWNRKEARQNSESSCISKVLSSMQSNLRAVKTGHWKSCHGSERRLKQCVCVREILCTWMDKSEDLQTPKRWIDSMAIAFYPHPFRFRFGANETRHKGDGYYNHRFFDRKILFILTGRCRRLTSPLETEEIYMKSWECRWLKENWKSE